MEYASCSEIHISMSTLKRSTLSAVSAKWADFQNIPWCTNWKLRSRPRRGSSPAISGPLNPSLLAALKKLKARKTTKWLHKCRLCGECADLGSAWLRLFRYVGKMAAVECEKSTPSGSIQYTCFCPNHIWNALRTQTKYTVREVWISEHAISLRLWSNSTFSLSTKTGFYFRGWATIHIYSNIFPLELPN